MRMSVGVRRCRGTALGHSALYVLPCTAYVCVDIVEGGGGRRLENGAV